jgi:hypothetical protein
LDTVLLEQILFSVETNVLIILEWKKISPSC